LIDFLKSPQYQISLQSIHPSQATLLHADMRKDRQTDGWTDMTKVIFAFVYLFHCTYKPAKLLTEESQFVSRQ